MLQRGFILLNDCYGHAKGDVVLQTVANRMQEIMRKDDVTVRTGGDEFVALITNCEAGEVAGQVANKQGRK